MEWIWCRSFLSFGILILDSSCLGCTADGTLSQWVVSVTDFSSEWTKDPGYRANEVIGPPDVYPNTGDIEGGWCIADNGVGHFVEVVYTTKVYITQVDVYEVSEPNMTSSIRAYTSDSEWITLWEGHPKIPTEDAQIFSPPLLLQGKSVYTNKLRVYINGESYWPNLDAIQMHGTCSPTVTSKTVTLPTTKTTSTATSAPTTPPPTISAKEPPSTTETTAKQPLPTTKRTTKTQTTTTTTTTKQPSPATTTTKQPPPPPTTTTTKQPSTQTKTTAKQPTITTTTTTTTKQATITTTTMAKQPTMTTTTMSLSTTTTRSTRINIYIMPCLCSAGAFTNLTTTELVEQLVKNLTVDKADLSSERRKLTSANDERTSSQTIGTVGVVIISVTFGSIFLLDAVRVVRFILKHCKRKIRRRMKRNAVQNE